MKIAEFLPESSIDYEGKIACVVFTSGCNFSCPSCHARKIVFREGKKSKEEIFSYLDSRKNWIDAVVLCGGEPTIQPVQDLTGFCSEIKKRNSAVKLDTNGYKPEVLEELLNKDLVDYVALDVKASPNLYAKVTGMANGFDITRIKSSLRIIQNFPHELRTTIVPILKDNNFCWFNEEEARNMASWVYDITGRKYQVLARGEQEKNGKNVWYLQQFVARSKEEMIAERFSAENLSAEMRKTPKEILEKIKGVMNEYFGN